MIRRLDAYSELQELARHRKPRAALILGSGLSDLADRLEEAVELPFQRVPGLDTPSIAGHRGSLSLGRWAGVPMLIFAGRLHYYEGHAWQRTLQPIRLARELGASILIVTNAAGGIRDDLQPGDLMALRDHLEWTRPNWWHEPHRPAPYSERLTQLLGKSAQELGWTLATGIYAQLTGPCYETCAEIRALRHCGADAVGMSTAREIVAGSELGMECAAISCITNKAAGLGTGPIHHEEVLATMRSARERLARLIEMFFTKEL
jgi:purine-nucleoside phosphorylase